MKYLFRKPHGGRKPQRVKLRCLPLLIAELNNKSSGKAYRAGEILFINVLKETDRTLRAGVSKAPTHLLVWGPAEGWGKNAGDRRGLHPSKWPPALPPKASGFQASRHLGQRALPPLSAFLFPGIVWPGPLIKRRALCLRTTALKTKVSGCLPGPLAVPSERDCAWLS